MMRERFTLARTPRQRMIRGIINGIALMIAGLLLFWFFLMLFSATSTSNGGTVTYGLNGVVESHCMDGYRVVVGARGHVTQLLDEQGHGIKCTR